MDTNEAELAILAKWAFISEKTPGSTVRVEKSMTEEHSWGWIVYLVVESSSAEHTSLSKHTFIINRESHRSLPVGTRSIHHMIEQLLS